MRSSTELNKKREGIDDDALQRYKSRVTETGKHKYTINSLNSEEELKEEDGIDEEFPNSIKKPQTEVH